MQLKALLVTGVAASALASPLGAVDQQAAAGVASVFARYAAGEYDAIRRVSVKDAGDVSDARKAAFEREADSATRAAFVLELVHAVHVTPHQAEGDSVVMEARRAFKDACDLVRRGHTSPEFARAWYAAAIAAMQNVGSRAIVILYEHLDHAEPYVPPGMLALARAHQFELQAWRAINVTGPSYDRNSPDLYEAKAARALPSQVKRAIDLLRPATEFREVRAEAWLRIAALTDGLGQSSEALPLFDRAEQHATDDWVRYLTRLLRGRALERLGDYAAARAQYQHALALRPNARSAHLALAANLYATGQPHEDALTNGIVSGGEGAPDPWAEFGNGDHRFWPERRDAMRALLK